MYINRKNHYLSNVIITAALAHIFADFIKFIIRALVRENESSFPDMADEIIWQMSALVSWLLLCILTLSFYFAWVKLKKMLSVVEESDQLQMALLQKEVLGDKTPTLSGDTISKLFQLWAAILIGARLVYDVCSNVYRNFITDLSQMIATENRITTDKFASLYNNSHGFTYLGLLIAIQLGVFATGIFLNDKLIKTTSIVLMAFFLVSFVALEMSTVSLLGISVGIVWTSIIFHLVETFGLLIFGVYLRKHYIGL